VKLAQRYPKAIIPGYTHLQRAQPVLLAHHLLAYVEMLERDYERLQEAGSRMDSLPLGSCALAGTSFKTDRRFLAKELKFSRVSENSMDAVSDRDFVIETSSTLAILGVHLSRFSEDLILWSTLEFGFIELPDAFSTGSSAMPHKKNPDSLELARGKSGRLIGNLTALLVLMKGLPLTYNRDLQEDKERIFDSVDTAKSVLEVVSELLPGIRFSERFLQGEEDFTSSLDLAEYLVRRGVPFRQAHEIVGRIVRYCIEKGKYFRDLSLEEVKSFSNRFDENFRNFLGWNASVRAKQSFGSTSPIEVKKAIQRWEKKLAKKLNVKR
jgi:argininosuccinate lyase